MHFLFFFSPYHFSCPALPSALPPSKDAALPEGCTYSSISATPLSWPTGHLDDCNFIGDQAIYFCKSPSKLTLLLDSYAKKASVERCGGWKPPRERPSSCLPSAIIHYLGT